MAAQEVKDILIRTLKENEREVPSEIGDDLNLFDEGVLDSITTMILLENLNKHYSLEMEGDVLFEDDFQTVAGISRIIEKLKN
jgi:acyl carrier protein